MPHLEFATLCQLAESIRKKSLSPVELTEYYLERIERLNPKLNAYIAVTAARARAGARAAEAALEGNHYLGPLHGIPIALKDLIDTAGIPTTGGSLIFKERIPARDATVARRLFRAGAVLLGKTQMVEFAYGGAGINHHYGTPWNPWDGKVQRLPGGSSSGSAVAVAADLAPAALGSDTGGSVRIPASFCGLVGFKPTFGRLSNDGLLPLDSRLDSAGPMSRSVADAALIYQLLAGPDPEEPHTWNPPCDDVLKDLDAQVAGMRLCLPREYFWDEVDPEVESAVRASVQVFADLGLHIGEIALAELDELAALRARGSTTAVETYLYFREYLEREPERFDPIVSRRMLEGREMSAVDYLEWQRDCAALRRRTRAALHAVDALLTPTTPFAAPPLAEVDTEERYFAVNGLCLRNTIAVNLLGLCAVNLPCGFTAKGLPIGLQLIGRPFDEARLLRLAHAYEQATPWKAHHPPLADFA